MNRILLFSTISLIGISTAYAGIPTWWGQDTVCRLNPAQCYPAMGNGYLPEIWDEHSGCWGMKVICPAALTDNYSEPTPVSRNELRDNDGINTDFDTNLLSYEDNCFGRRKTTQDGLYATVDGNSVMVWCNGVWSDADEQLPNGEIETEQQPTCDELSRDGFAAVENGNCFGKYYDSAKYQIVCNAKNIKPEKFIILNGANFSYSDGDSDHPLTPSDADDIFDDMYDVSKLQKAKYFKK